MTINVGLIGRCGDLVKIDGIKVEISGILPRHRDAVVVEQLTQQLLEGNKRIFGLHLT
jgi:hypothetical protein